jgi:hypothetical protein
METIKPNSLNECKNNDAFFTELLENQWSFLVTHWSSESVSYKLSFWFILVKNRISYTMRPEIMCINFNINITM